MRIRTIINSTVDGIKATFVFSAKVSKGVLRTSKPFLEDRTRNGSITAAIVLGLGEDARRYGSAMYEKARNIATAPHSTAKNLRLWTRYAGGPRSIYCHPACGRKP
tara:strand:- start:1476 stop:1793 length:318 start_codon:yes stop_codon:yes gene_type:complete